MRDIYTIIMIIICVLVAGGAIVYALFVTKRSSDTIRRLNDMLDKAKDGKFKAEEYTESEISAFECRFADFLDSSLINENNILDEKNRIKSMISDISHQTKTPIANLLLYSELLGESDSIGEEEKESVEIIHGQTEKLRFLIDSLVKLSRLENGLVAPNAEKNSLKELIDSAVSELGGKAKSKGLELTFSDADHEDIEAFFDMKWTDEALSNIIDNAIKYTDEGFVEISMSATDVFARIDVKDTGIGISEEESSQIFKRFYRSADVANEEGVGVGLYLAREIISAEGGYIRLNSVKGEGTTFSLFLPTNGTDTVI